MSVPDGDGGRRRRRAVGNAYVEGYAREEDVTRKQVQRVLWQDGSSASWIEWNGYFVVAINLLYIRQNHLFSRCNLVSAFPS
jgi:hypothetical protein